MSSDPRQPRRTDAERPGQTSSASGWRVEHDHAVYRADLFGADPAWADPGWERRVPRGRFALESNNVGSSATAPNTSNDADSALPAASAARREITLDTARAYDMLRASASLSVPLLCLATKG